MAAERANPSLRNRKTSVSFGGMTTSKAHSSSPAKEMKSGRQPASRPVSRLVSSAGSRVSTTSTWSFVSQPAASLQALRTRILITIEKALTLIKNFEKKFLDTPDDDFHGVYQEFVKQLLARIGYKTDLVNADHLDSVIIRRFQTEPAVASRLDFKALTVVTQRAKAFKELKSQVQARIDEVMNYADSFCATFSSETEGYSFECVENYENMKTECLREIGASLESVQASSDELRDIQPLSVYLESYGRVLHYIEHVTHCLSNATLSLKRWIIGDEQYEKSIEKEIMYLRQRAKQLAGDRLSISSLRFEVVNRNPNEAGKVRRVDLTVQRLTSALEKQKEQQRSVSRQICGIREDQRGARRELATVERQSTRRMRPGEVLDLLPEAERLRAKILRLQTREDDLSTKLSNANDKVASITRELHSLEQEKLRRRKVVATTSHSVSELRSAQRDHSDATNSLSQKIRILDKLKSLKNDREILRKMEFNMINIDYREAMQSSIRQIGHQVGVDWPQVYMKLPFMPPRTAEKLQRDIKVIQMIGEQTDKSPGDMAVVAFEKWAKRSTAASVNELTFTAKPYTSANAKKEFGKRANFCVPRAPRRFRHLELKANVIYV